MVAVVPVGMVAQKQQVISHLTGGLPQPLLPLPAVPAVQPEALRITTSEIATSVSISVKPFSFFIPECGEAP
jgi:hypothetical protein